MQWPVHFEISLFIYVYISFDIYSRNKSVRDEVLRVWFSDENLIDMYTEVEVNEIKIFTNYWEVWVHLPQNTMFVGALTYCGSCRIQYRDIFACSRAKCSLSRRVHSIRTALSPNGSTSTERPTTNSLLTRPNDVLLLSISPNAKAR